MEELLRATHLRKSFPAADGNDFLAVDDVTFSVGEGEKVAIIGESVSGKTTVAKMVTRLLDATSGSIILEGQDITKASGRKLRQAYRKMQMVFQMPVESFDPRRTLGDGITEGLRNHGRSKKDAAAEWQRLLERCGLETAFADRYPHEVSGGQCQRAAIARALALSPDILCFDEPTSALDPELTGEVLRVIRALAEQKTTMIIVTHEMAFARDVADQVVFMDGGVIVEQGDARQVIEHPREERTRQFLARYSEN